MVVGKAFAQDCGREPARDPSVCHPFLATTGASFPMFDEVGSRTGIHSRTPASLRISILAIGCLKQVALRGRECRTTFNLSISERTGLWPVRPRHGCS